MCVDFTHKISCEPANERKNNFPLSPPFSLFFLHAFGFAFVAQPMQFICAYRIRLIRSESLLTNLCIALWFRVCVFILHSFHLHLTECARVRKTCGAIFNFISHSHVKMHVQSGLYVAIQPEQFQSSRSFTDCVCLCDFCMFVCLLVDISAILTLACAYTFVCVAYIASSSH